LRARALLISNSRMTLMPGIPEVPGFSGISGVSLSWEHFWHVRLIPPRYTSDAQTIPTITFSSSL
jgi:hypothetical protein